MSSSSFGCPCCGLIGISGIGDICWCGWEFESYELKFPDAPGGANGGRTLRDWQAEFIARAGGREAFRSSKELSDGAWEYDPNWALLDPPFDGWPIVDPDLPLSNATCPCCGYKTIHGGFARCPICCWRYCAGSYSPDFHSPVNCITLREAQRNYKRIGAIREQDKKLSRRPTRSDRRDPNWQLLRALASPFSPNADSLIRIVTCPCCGFRTNLGECDFCCWRYLLGHRDPRDHSKPNPIRLRKAQQNFVEHGVWTTGHDEWDQPFEPRTLPDPALKDPNWRPLDV
ncbi:MAG: CPCC family cysteine-rich protein [Pirellulales bacterium]